MEILTNSSTKCWQININILFNSLLNIFYVCVVIIIRVSSVLNDKKSLHGGSKMFDGNPFLSLSIYLSLSSILLFLSLLFFLYFKGNTETCWNSKQGSPQSLRVKFENAVNVNEVQIMFQGGFVGIQSLSLSLSLSLSCKNSQHIYI